MNNIIKGLLISTLLILLSVSVVSANDINDTLDNKDILNNPEINEYSNVQNENILDENIISDNDNSAGNYNSKINKIYAEENKASENNEFVLNNNNWNDYFTDDGEIIEEKISSGSVLVFDGTFEDKEVVITIPVNITSVNKNAFFTNSVFYILSDGVNMTDISMTSENSEYLLYMEEASSVSIINNSFTLINNEDMMTHTISIEGGSNVVIAENDINTVCPHKEVDWSTNTFQSISIYSLGVDNLTIDSNMIVTTANDNYVNPYSTESIYGICLKGTSNSNKFVNGKVTNNVFITSGKRYIYSAIVLMAENILIENNTITTTSMEYANGISLEVVLNSHINHNNINVQANNYTYAIYSCGRDSNNPIYAEGNVISNNTLVSNSMITYCVELYVTRNNTICYNNISAVANFTNGIATGQSNNNIMEYNNINLESTMQGSLPCPDAIDYSPAGIKTMALNKQSGMGDNNIIRYNEIRVNTTDNQKVPTVDISTNYNKIYLNTLQSTMGEGEDTVKDTGINNEVYNNSLESSPKKVIIKLEDISLYTNDAKTITLNITDEEDTEITEGNVQVFIDDMLIQNIILTENQQAKFTIKNLLPGDYILDVIYTSDDEEKYISTSNSSIIEVKKADVIVTCENMDTVTYGDNITFTGKFTDNNNKSLTNSNIYIIINNRKYSSKTNEKGYYNYTTQATKLGINTVSVGYSGNTKYNPYNIDTVFDVLPQNTIINVNSIDDTKYSDNVTITGTLTTLNDKAITNTNVLITINNKTLSSRTNGEGVFVFTSKASRLGINDVLIEFRGNTYYNKYSTNTTFNVIKQDLIIKLEDIKEVGYGSNVTISGKFTDANGKALANSNVRIEVSGKKVNVKTDANGDFMLSIKTNTFGNNTIKASYLGNNYYNDYSTTSTFNVVKQNLSITIDKIETKDNITIKGTFKDVDNNILANSNVRIIINGKKYSTKSDSNGIYTFTIPSLNVESINITVEYSGSARYNPYQRNETIIITV